jgi:hypothetical protein
VCCEPRETGELFWKKSRNYKLFGKPNPSYLKKKNSKDPWQMNNVEANMKIWWQNQATQYMISTAIRTDVLSNDWRQAYSLCVICVP